MKSSAPQTLSLMRQPLQQAAASTSIVRDPARPAHIAQYIRINYFSSDATETVMKVPCPPCLLYTSPSPRD